MPGTRHQLEIKESGKERIRDAAHYKATVIRYTPSYCAEFHEAPLSLRRNQKHGQFFRKRNIGLIER